MTRLIAFSAIFPLLMPVMAQQQWTLQPSTTATTLVGVGAGSDTAIAAAAMDGTGAVAEVYADGKWSNSKVGGGLLLDAAKSNDGTLSVVTSLLPVFVQDTTVSSDFVQAVGVGGAITSASFFGDNEIGLVGSVLLGKKSINGVVVSTDRGKTFSASPVPSGFTRYGSFIDSQTWVVSAGIWGDDANSTAAHEVNYNHQDVSLSARLRAGKGGKIQRVGGDEPPVNCSTMDGWPPFLLPPMAASPTKRRSAPPKAHNTTSTASAALAQPAWLWLKATRLAVEPWDLPSPAQIWARPGPRPSTVTSYSVSWPLQ